MISLLSETTPQRSSQPLGSWGLSLTRFARRRGRRGCRRLRTRRFNSRTAAVVVFAAAVVADNANRPAVRVGGHHRVNAIGLAGAAVVFDRIAGSIGA